MNVLKNQPFFRPVSQPTSLTPLPTSPPSDVADDHSSRPLNMLSLSNFRRNPTASRAQTPVPTNLILDSSYLEVLGLKLSEATTRALTQPTGPAPANEILSGKRPIPQGRGHTLGDMIVLELRSAQGNPQLHKAIVRSLHKPLSVLLNNLSANLFPLLASPAIHAPPSLTSPNPNPTQSHVLAIATFAAELLEKIDELDVDTRSDGLKTIREGLTAVVTRVVNSLVLSLKDEFMRLLEAFEDRSTDIGNKSGGGDKSSIVSIYMLQALIPVYGRCLARYTCFEDAQPILASFLITVIWKILVAFAHRPRPSQLLLSQQSSIKKRSSPTSTPPMTPPPSRFAIKLPSSRPSSPQPVSASPAVDAQMIYELLAQFPRPTGSREKIRFAREAVEEAFNGLRALITLLKEADTACLKVEPDFKLERDISDLPLLIALPIILQTWGRCSNSSVANMIGLSEDQYRKSCLCGFGRAEECETTVAQHVLQVLRQEINANRAVQRWIEGEIAAD